MRMRVICTNNWLSWPRSQDFSFCFGRGPGDQLEHLNSAWYFFVIFLPMLTSQLIISEPITYSLQGTRKIDTPAKTATKWLSWAGWPVTWMFVCLFFFCFFRDLFVSFIGEIDSKFPRKIRQRVRCTRRVRLGGVSRVHVCFVPAFVSCLNKWLLTIYRGENGLRLPRVRGRMIFPFNPSFSTRFIHFFKCIDFVFFFFQS